MGRIKRTRRTCKGGTPNASALRQAIFTMVAWKTLFVALVAGLATTAPAASAVTLGEAANMFGDQLGGVSVPDDLKDVDLDKAINLYQDNPDFVDEASAYCDCCKGSDTEECKDKVSDSMTQGLLDLGAGGDLSSMDPEADNCDQLKSICDLLPTFKSMQGTIESLIGSGA